ncbi:MucBP domain-containing protein [Listeria booriae]|uniref:MucBP domain-containing protein n=1 Tax=Listeria booriae TaxID=1552123 RepID=UPI001624CBC6|nr:MucBP domain-containing protein [Listeria booriae]MBC2170492.1 hypothetical protein [Listeria booriae]
MLAYQRRKKYRRWVHIGLTGVLLGSGIVTYVPKNSSAYTVEAKTLTTSKATNTKPTIPANSTYRSLFPDLKLAMTVAAETGDFDWSAWLLNLDDYSLDCPVMQEKLNQVTKITENWGMTENPMQKIEGVQYLHNLKRLYIGDSGGWSGVVENLDRLAGLDKLEELSIVNNKVQDISGIKNLTNLTYLNLSENKITDASPIAGLTKLEHIDFARENRIQSLAPFRQLTHLKKLFLSTSVSDFRPLQDLPLIQDPNATWALVGNITLPDAYVGEPVFMQAFDPTGEQVLFGGVMVDGKWEGMKAYDGKYATYSKVGMGNVTFTQSLSEPSGTNRYIRVDFKQRVLPAKATVQPVTVRYVDDQGEVLAPEECLTGILGEAYEVQAKTIDGYQLTEEPVNRIGTFGTEAQTVTFVYTKETKVTTIPAGSTFASVFPDYKLALQVAMEIYPQTRPDKIDVKKEVTQAELDRVTIIEDDPALGDPIGNIEGVQYLRNLEDLWVGIAGDFRGKVENLDVLSNLTKLKVLAVKNQALSDISGLKNLTNLTYLNLTDNKITNADPIAGLTKLEYISLDSGNNIQSLAPFRQLTNLKKLYLNASVSDFRPLQHLPLIQDSSSTWHLNGTVQLPDAYVGEPVFMQAFDPFGDTPTYGAVEIDGNWRGGTYKTPYMRWEKSGEKGQVWFQSPEEGITSKQYMNVFFQQRVLPAKATVQAVTVRYVDDQGEVLAPEERLTGVLGEAYEAKAKTIDGYQLTEEPVNRIGTFGTEAQTVTFVYTKETKATTIPAGSTFASVFPDYKLALQVAMEIYPQTRPDKIDVKKEVTQAELDRVTIIEDDPDLGDPIGNIEGVQYLRNLEDLWVGIAGDFRGKVENLDVLSNLTKLKVLAVKNQALSDISGIKNLTNLTYLNLTDNKITNADPIAGLTKLEYISLDSGNNIQSLAPFRQLTNLKKLYLNASVSDFRPLQHLPLIQDASNTWELRGEVQLLDAYVGEPVFMQAFDPFGEASTYGSVKLDGKLRGGKYTTPYMRWEESGEKGQVTFQGSNDEASSGNYMRVIFKQRVLPAKATVQPVTVRYVDDQGEVLAPEERLTGVLGEAYEAQAKTIDGYQLTKEPVNRVGTFSTEAQTVTFVYTKEAVPVSQAVTVRHLDIEGKVVAPEEVLTGAIGDTYEAQAKVVSGYRLVTIPANQTGTFGTEAQTVTFIYAQETAPPMVQPVTVQYVDDQGKALTQEETLTGALGALYQAEAKTIPGYQLTSLPSNHTGTFQAVAQTVRFVYTKQTLPLAQPVTVQHVDAQGKAVAEEDILYGNTGETYHAKAKVISGYHVSEHPANAMGIFGPSAQTVRFVYAPDESIEAINPVEEEPTTPPKPSLPSPVTEDTRTPALPLPTEVSSETSPSVVPVVPGPALPSLGERTTHAIGWGSTLLLVGTWLFLRSRYPSSKRKRS